MVHVGFFCHVLFENCFYLDKILNLTLYLYSLLWLHLGKVLHVCSCQKRDKTKHSVMCDYLNQHNKGSFTKSFKKYSDILEV